MKYVLLITGFVIAMAGCKKKELTNTLLDQVNNESELVIHYESSGCFSYVRETIVISKSAGEFKWRKICINYHDTAISQGDCSSKFRKAYTRFEKEGRQYHTKNRCTSFSSWNIEANNQSVNFTDGDCMLTGYTELQNTLK